MTDAYKMMEDALVCARDLEAKHKDLVISVSLYLADYGPVFVVFASPTACGQERLLEKYVPFSECKQARGLNYLETTMRESVRELYATGQS